MEIFIIIIVVVIVFAFIKGSKKNDVVSKTTPPPTPVVKVDPVKTKLGGDLTGNIEEKKEIKRLANPNRVNETILKYVEKRNIWICPVCDAENLHSNPKCCVCEIQK